MAEYYLKLYEDRLGAKVPRSLPAANRVLYVMEGMASVMSASVLADEWTACASATLSVNSAWFSEHNCMVQGGADGVRLLRYELVEPWFPQDIIAGDGASETLLLGWTFELYRNNGLLASTLTDVNGVFLFSGLIPNLPTGTAYELRYLAPGAAANSATLGNANSVFTDSPHRITDIFAASGSSIQNLNLPIQPNGVVYDSVLRVPVAGVQLSMINQTRSNQSVPTSCFDDPNHQNQVTLAAGFYKFDLNFSDPARCAEGDEYERHWSAGKYECSCRQHERRRRQIIDT